MSLGFAVGTLPGLKLDREGIAVVGAVATACDRIAYPVRSAAAIDWTTIILLFAMMMIVGILKVYGFFRWLSKNVVARTHTSHHRIATFILLSGVLSAFIVNDIIRVAFTSLVLRLCRRMHKPLEPYLMGLVIASNISSVATITGNPQCFIIGSLSKIPYWRFCGHLAPIAIFGLMIDFVAIALVYRRQLSQTNSGTVPPEIPTASRAF